MGIFDGKVAIITGGGKAKSIGYGIAVAYAKEGANLAITGRNEKKLLDAKEELERLYGIKVLPLQADVTPDEKSEEVVKETVKKVADTFGRIDVLINNAQASASGIPLSMHMKDHFDLGIYSGLYAVFYYMRACYPYLKETQGSVINFASGGRAVRQCGTEFLCGGEGRHPRDIPCGGDGMGQGQYQCQCSVPAGNDRTA